ncbi:hypothetical protein C8R47DRAFT_1078123 [Mycena vitilis]|nr:hypothetical protein C8R47DRAFT_1078123 [Mycena vitilis]
MPPMDDVTATVFVKPSCADWLAATPDHRDKNPHRQRSNDGNDAQAQVHRMGFQSRSPEWTPPVIPMHVALENVSDEVRDEVTQNSDEYLALTPFCGGAMLFAEYKSIRADATGVLEEVAGKNKLTLIRPLAKTAIQGVRRGAKPDKFAPPHILLIRCSDVPVRNELLDIGTFASTRILAFHVTAFNAALLSWALGFFRTDIDDPPEVTARRLCHAVYEGWLKSPKMLSLIDRATQGGSTLTSSARLILRRRSMDPHLWDEIRSVSRMMYTDALEPFHPHGNAATGHNLCADCKFDCHPKYNCLFTIRDEAFWGPLDLAAALKDIRGGASDDESKGSRRGAPRGRTSGGRGGGGRARGRGRY